MIKEVLYVGAGGFIGSVMRYLVSVAMKHSDSGFPWGTFIVNIVGCFAIGILGGLINRNPNISTEMGLFLTLALAVASPPSPHSQKSHCCCCKAATTWGCLVTSLAAFL